MIYRLSEAALNMIEHFEHLHIGTHQIRTPYFNNKKTDVRAALRVMVGKGSPHDIEQEAFIMSLREKVNLDAMNEEEIRRYLVDHHLGVDCSGFVYHVLDAELQATKHSSMKRTLSFPFAKNIFRKTISKLRSAENTNVKVLAHEKNSKEIQLKDIRPGDMITMIGTGEEHTLDHVLLVTEVHEERITYTHSLNWKTDGKYNHGIRRGTITIVDPKKSLLDQQWEEDGETSKEKNETYWRAQTAHTLSIRRLT